MNLSRNILTSSSMAYRSVARICRRDPRRILTLPDSSRLYCSTCSRDNAGAALSWRRNTQIRNYDGHLIQVPSATTAHQTRGYSSSKTSSVDVCPQPSTDADAKNPTIKTEPSTKLFLSFTCKECNGSNSYLISKKAYNHGVVIVTCSTCSSHHLIADHLHWFPQSGGGRTIEEILAEKGEKVTKFLSTEVKEIVPDEDGR